MRTLETLDNALHCNQCEQTAHGRGCSINGKAGVCGKDADVQSLQEMLLYGVKGMAAYAHHARRMGRHDEKVSAFIEEALFATMTNVNFDFASLFELVLECGRQNLRVMEMLEEAHVSTFGEPAPATVKEGTRRGPGILVTGHDLPDLMAILRACEGTDVGVYTHGEMLPAHMYPRLHGHPNLAGHFGGAWQKQKQDFERFPGAIVATTNCVLIPKESYRTRLVTTRATAVPGCRRLTGEDFSEVVALAKSLPHCTDAPVRESVVGFSGSVILSKAGAIVDAVKAGKIRRFFLIGGCDGAEPGRNYYADYAWNAPQDTFVLTLGCGKYRIRDHEFGEHLGLPRLLDMGQCNDAYGAIRVASALAKAFDCSVSELPLTIVLSWFEQKAVAVLLTLLALDVKNIAIGPNLPAFVTPNVLRALQERYGLKAIGTDGRADVLAAVGATA